MGAGLGAAAGVRTTGAAVVVVGVVEVGVVEVPDSVGWTTGAGLTARATLDRCARWRRWWWRAPWLEAGRALRMGLETFRVTGAGEVFAAGSGAVLRSAVSPAPPEAELISTASASPAIAAIASVTPYSRAPYWRMKLRKDTERACLAHSASDTGRFGRGVGACGT